MKIRVYLRQDGTTVTATLPSGAFTPTNVNLSLTDSGGSSPTTPAISLAAGKTSNTLTVSSTQTAAFASTNPLTYTGTPALTLTGADIVSTVQVPGFCNRTAQVQTTILATSAAAAANNNCLEVSADMLAAITILDLGRTGITALQAGDFDGLTALQTLKLNDNSITSNSTTLLPAGLFDGLTSLQNLFLAGNRGITALPAGLLAGLTSLQNFYLNHTGVATLPAGIFDGLSSLQDIYLNHSRITSLPEGLFAGLSSLEVLHIHTNSLPSLPAGIFAGLSSLTDLQLYSNQLTALPANLFNGLSNLQNLYLNNNSIATLPAAVFAGPSSLQNLYLNSNSIASLPEDLFDGLSSLQNLYLNNNSIASLPAGLFAGLSSLADLRLGSNQLATLPEDPFDGLTALTALHLENNDIATLPNDIFTGFSATLGTLRLQAQTNANVAMKVPLYLHQVGNVVIANIRAGAPAALTVNLSVTSSGGGAATTAAIVIPVGGTHNSITLVPTGGETLTAAFAATPATLDIADLQGVAYETGTLAGGICSRTPAVQNKLQALTAPTFCDQVDATDLAGITTLDLSNAGIESLQAGDFADLTELTTLNLSGNSLTALPSGVFTDLAKVTTLNLSGNHLTTPSLDTGDPAAGIFAPLTAMTGLDLSNNRLTALPAGIFTFGTNTGKSALTNLDLSSQSGLVGNLRMSLQPSWDSGTAMVTLEVPSGVPAALTVILATADSGVAGNSIALTVPLGATSVSASLTGTAVTLGPSSSVPGWNNGITVATGLDFSFGICDRTMQVQAALLARARLLTGVDSNIGCGGVTDTMLAKLGTGSSSNPGGGGANILDLRGSTLTDNSLTKITSLQANDFAGLSGFPTLYLQGNELTELPVGVFNGLTAVTSVSLQENQIATIPPGVFNSMPLSNGVDLSKNALAVLPKDLFTGRTAGIGGLALGNQFDDDNDNRVTQPTMDIPVFLLRSGNRLTLTVPPGAPNALTVNLTITSSPANTTSTQTITIPVGRTTATANLTPASGQTLSAAFASASTFSHSSLTLLGGQFVGRIPGICNRSPAVQTAIIAKVPATSCEDVSDDMLSAITGTLDLSDSITALRAGDLAMLTGLTGLNLSDNGLTALPAGIFDDLVALTTLDLSDNRLTTLPASIFNNLLLATFDFSGNQLTANVLDSDDPTTSIFAPLTALTSLDLSENEIKFLPDGIFAFGTNTKKSALTNLDLRDQNGLDGNLQLILKPTGNSSTNTVAVEVPAGVPAALTVPLTVTDSSGTLSQTLTMPAGATTITDEATLTGGVTVTTAGTPSWASGTTIRGLGFTFGICDRTEQVQALLLAYLNNGTTCSTVTDAMLNNLSGTAYGGLNFNADNRGIFNDLPGVSKLTSLKANDFAGLSSIESVSLRDNNLTELPAGVFNGLSSVQALYLSENKIATIAPFVLKPLTNLRFTLSLGQNALSALPKDFFTGQTQRLRQLLLSNQFADPDDGIPTAEFIDIPVHLLQDGSHLTLTVPTGSPVDLTVNLTITSSPANTTSTESIVIPIGQTTGTATLTPATGQTLSAAFASADPFSYSDTVYSSDPGLPTSTLTFEGGRFVGQILGICNRSPAVQIALLAKVPATVCSGVSDTMLQAVTGALDLSSASLSALLPIDFDLLTALQELNLSDNSLATLPDGIFDDLRSLTKLDLSGNHMATGALTITAMTPGDPATSIFAPLAKMVDLDLSDNRIETLPDGIFTGFPRALTKFDLSSQNDSSGTALGSNLKMLVKPSWASGTITVSVPTGVPASMVLMFDAVGGEADAINVTVPSNTTTGSAALAVSAPSTTVWLSLSAAPTFSGATITGLDLETGICGRNAAVQAKLVAAITLSKNCAEIDATDLATITTTLDLSNLGIAALDAGDLADLTEVPTLNLTGNALTTLPEDVFKDLGKVTALTLTNNKLSDSASSVFATMAALTALNIEGNEFSILPANFFKGLRNELHIDAGMQFNDNPDSGGSDIAEADSIMTLSLVKNDSNEVTVDFPAATFADLTVNLDLEYAVEGSTGTVEVLAGTNSNATPLSLTASGRTPTAAINTTTPATVGADNTPSVTGITYEIVEPGICDRTMQVQTAILALVTPTNCAEVSNSILNDITGTLDLSIASPSLSTLQVGDFDDLIKLQTLNLSSNSLSALPAGIFTELDAMTSLNLSGNEFVSLTGLFADLGGITTLNLSDNQLTTSSLDTGDPAAGIFAPLIAMTSLDLSGNELTELPNGIFAGLTAALNTKLDVSGQFRNDSTTANINNFDVLLDLSVDGSNVATVTIPTGAPQALTVNLDLTGHDTSSSPPSPTSVPIAIGATSGTVTLIPATSGGTVTAILNATPPTLTATTGITLITGADGICNRNEVVEAALLAKIGGGATCDSVTESILNSLSGTLDLSVASGVTPTITATNNLADSDFADLILIDTVDLGNQGLTTIAAGLFDAMTSLATLDLSGNSLSALPTRIFDDLVVLTNLNLSANQIASLDADAFTGLALLEVLNLSGNALAALPAALLSSAPGRPLTKLAELDLSENKLTSLPATLLNGLNSISTLKLVGNLLTSLPAGFFEGTDTLTTLSLENQGNDAGETLLAAIPLTLRPQVTGTTASVLLTTGAPTALTLTLSVTDGGSTSNSAAITIDAGATTSSTVTVSSTSATVSPNAPTNVPATFTGLAWLTSGSTSGASGICDRTDQVQAALLALVNGDTPSTASGYKYCGDVVTADLNGLSGTLDLRPDAPALALLPSITALKLGDFAALTALTTLDLSGNDIEALTAGLFTDLTDLTTLDLSGNDIEALADSRFSTLTALTSLDLSANQLIRLGANTFAGLTKLETLNLRANQLREARIDAATLAPLTALTSLDLHGNELTGLPDSLFSGVSTLTSLDLRDQFSNDDQIPTLPTVTLSLVPLVQDTTVQVQAPSGAPTDLSVPLAVTEGTLSPTSLTIAAGDLNSGNSTLTPDAGAVSNTISITDDPTYDSTNFLGIRWETGATANPAGGICARTPQVQIALLARVNGTTTVNMPGYKACQDIGDTDLAALTGTLDLSSNALTALSSTSITRLSPGDFADLTGITTLTLTGHTGNTGLTGLPTNILVGLSALTTLNLSGNALTALPTNPFNGLTGSTLTSIDLSSNALTALPPLSFGSLTALTTLDLGDNALTALNARAFSGATALTSLDLRNNAIASLAGATLAPFAATLTTLHLQGNELTALPDGFFRGATALTTLNAGLQTSTETDISLALKPVFDGGGLRLLLATGAPVALTMNVATTSGTLTPTSLTIAAGATLSSGASTLSYSGTAPTVSISSDPTVANTITGLAWDRTATATPVDGICGRTAQVRDALLALINGDAVLGDSGYVACQDADSSLASLTGTLDLRPDAPALASSQPITALKVGDFAGLPALTGLDLSGNDLSALPASPPFSALAALTSLDLSGNDLTSTAVVSATFTGLAALTSLDLSDNDLTTLAADLLSIPAALTSLDLSDNRIATLPAGFFSGITSLTSLDASDQDHDGGNGITLTIRPILSGDKISLLLPAGAPTGLTVPLATTGGTATPSTLRFAAGNTLSNQATFIAVGSSSLSVSVAQTPTYNAIAFAGLLWDTSATLDPSAGICSRTAAVKDALVALVNDGTAAGAPGYKYCQDIVAGDLTALTGELDLNAAGITQLRDGDFADLSGITEVDLGGNSLIRLDANIFTGLSTLTSLDLSGNSLTYLVAGSLTGLPTTLTTLTMSGNTLTRLPSNLFSTLTGLTSLDLSGNDLASLPISPFTTLASLTQLSLQNNNLTRVTASVFSGLAALTTLNMQGNDMDQFPGGVLAPLSALEILNLRGNDLTELPGGFFAGVTTLTTLDLSDQVSVGTNLAIALSPVYLSGTAQVRIPTGAPVALSVVLTPYNAGTALATQTLSIPAGATLSEVSAALPATTTQLGIATPTGAALMGVSGVTWTVPADAIDLSSGICGRTAQVRDALLALINGDTALGDSSYVACQDATASLASLTGTLDLSPDAPALASSPAIAALKAGDFDDLSALTSLDLSGNTLTELPASPFSALAALTRLDLSDNALTTLAADLLNAPTALTSLDLSDNRIATLPDGFFEGITSLTSLDASGQDHDDDGSGITLTLTPEAADLQISVQLPTGAPTALDIILMTDDGTLTPIDPAPAQSASQSSAQSASQPSAQSAVPTLPNAVPAGPNAVPTLPDAVPAAGQTAATVRIAAGGTDSSTDSSAVLFTSGTNADTHQVRISADPILPDSFIGLEWNIDAVATPREGICSRTAQVRDVLLAAVNGDTMPGTTGYKSCDDIGTSDLQAITSNLDLRPDAPALASSPPITSLKPGDFANLIKVTGLNLSGNQITDLPSILFSGLDALTSLDLSDNWLGSMTPTELFGADGDGGLFGVLKNLKDDNIQLLDVSGNPGTLSLARVTIKRTGFDKLQITRSPMLPVEWEVPLTIDGGQLPQPSVTIAAGDAMSPEFDIVPESPYTSGTFVGIDTSGNPAPDGFYGFDINYRKLNVEVGICKRTPQVQKAILEQVVLASTCRDVTAQLLAAYDGPLDMSGKSVTALRVGDFVGLHRMRHLHLQDNQLTSLSADILAPLIGMHVLSLARNHLTTLPADAFDALAKLTTLDLRGNRLDSLPDATFGTAPRLTHLYLQDNQLAELPAGIFGTDPRLTHLYLHNNQIAALPAGIFGAAPGLTHLYLHNNQLASLPDATFSGFTPGLTELSLQDNPGAPFALTTNLVVDEDAKTVQVQVPLAAPEALTIPFTLTGGASDQNVEASLAAGTFSSAPQTVAFAADNAPVTASLDSLPTLSDGITGIELVAGDDTVVIRNGICGHTPEVRDAILADANVTSDCGSVSATELALVRTLALNRKDIAELTVYDFIGLAGLTTLDLSENALTELPAGVFDRPDGVFAGLAALTTLNLSGNAIAELPAGIFADLTSLATLNLHDNAVDPFKFAVDLTAAETAAGFDISATVADDLPTPAGSLAVHARVHADRTTSAVRSFTPPAALSVATTVNIVAISALCFGENPTDSDGTGCEGKNPSFTGVLLTAGAAIVVDPHPTFDGVVVADLNILQRAETNLQLPAAIAMVPTGVPAPTFTYSLTASEGGTQLDGMPAGLAFDAATRTLSGRAAAAGVFSMVYGVRDDNGDDDSLSFTLTVTAQDNDTYRNLHAQILSRFAITVADNAGQAIADRVDRMVRGQKPRFSTNAEATAVEIPFKGAWSIWTQDERTQTTQSTAADWDWSGSVNSQHTGVDWQSPGSTFVLGMMAQDSNGSFSYTGRAGAVASLAGDYRTPLTGEHFYLGWSPRGQNSTSWFTFWMASGSGSGEMNLSGIGGPNLRSDIDLDTSHFSIAITPVNVMRGLRIKLRAEMSTADLSLAASKGVDPMSLEVTRERVLLEPSTPSLLASDHQQLTLSAEIGTRTDSTSVSGFADGDITGLPQGEGDEYGLKLRYTWKHIDIEAGARSMQLDSDEGSYEEEGYFMTFSLGSCKNCSHNRGFAMSLSPTWGNISSGAQRLWDESHLNRVGPVSSGSDAGTDTAKSLSTEFSYGLALPVGGRAVMVPYSRLQTGGDNQWSTAFGTRLQFGDNFEVNFERTGQIGGQSSTAGELKLGATLRF